MSIIFQTLKKLNNPSAENIQKQVGLKENMRTSSLTGKQLRNSAVVLSVFMMGAAVVFLFYPFSDPINLKLNKNNTSAAYSVANASIVPVSPESSIQAIFLSDENVRKHSEDSGSYIFLPPEISEEPKEPSVIFRQKTKQKKRPSAQNKISDKSHFRPERKDRKSIAGTVISEQKIVKRIEISIIEGEIQKAEKLLEQLAAIKGEDSIYVMKLRAFFFLRTGENRPAVALLKKVLARNADDVEAGINMAFLEIRSKEYEQAKKRLTRLKSRYPENMVVSNLLSRLD
jgi:tetratricopeptide (TPR) repeat protein